MQNQAQVVYHPLNDRRKKDPLANQCDGEEEDERKRNQVPIHLSLRAKAENIFINELIQAICHRKYAILNEYLINL